MGGEPGEGKAALLDNVVLEESSEDSSADEGGSGLELDARQAAEIRKIFLTTLPDYLTPIKEMVAKLSSDGDGDGQIRTALSKTIASIADAASRVKLDDVAASMQGLREEVILLGDPGEPQEPLRRRIATALSALGDLAQAGGAAEAEVHRETHSETIVAVLTNVDGVDGASVQKLVAAGVIYVDQLCEADPKEIVMVSGLDALTVATLVRLARERSQPGAGSRSAAAGVAASPLVPEPLEELGSGPPPSDLTALAPALLPPTLEAFAAAPAGEPGERSQELVRTLVDDELALDEARGEALRLRLHLQTLRDEASAIERQCDTLKSSAAEARERAAERAAMLTRAVERRSTIERDHASTLAALEETAQRLTALRAERQEAIAELERLANETSGVTSQVEQVLEHQEAQEGK
jgi:hypothetical protein